MKRLLFLAMMIIAPGLYAQNPARIGLQLWADTLGPPVDIANCGDDRLFVATQNGWIYIVADSQVVVHRRFLTLGNVFYAGEQGLLGLAFDPDYANNGIFYVHYVSNVGGLHNRISRFHVSSDPDSADTASEEIIYTVPQPYDNHKGGDLAFGPDGMLYAAFGDGGSGGDPDNHAQDLTDVLGDMIRIDVSDPDTTWTVPPDNPYVNAGNDTLPEIWASGFRNPFRFGFDAFTGDLWVGDVGQSEWEEWDFLPAGSGGGANFGWHCFEGEEAYVTVGCQAQSFYEGPALVHLNAFSGGTYCAAIGGRVYRGSQWPHLHGRYFYVDYCAGLFNNLRPDGNGGWIDELSLATGTTGWDCIGENSAGELFAGNLGQGKIYRIVDRCPMDAPIVTQDGSFLVSSTANSYTWFLNGDTIPDATGQYYEPLATGEYHVVGDFGNGCLLNSDTLTFIFTWTGDQDLPAPGIAPNPADASVLVTCPGAEGLRYRVCDASGRTIQHGTIDRTAFTLDTNGSAPGAYTLQVVDPSGNVLARARYTIVH